MRAWYRWYACRIGWPEAVDLPCGEFLDLVTVEQVKREGFELRAQKDGGDIWSLLGRE